MQALRLRHNKVQGRALNQNKTHKTMKKNILTYIFAATIALASCSEEKKVADKVEQKSAQSADVVELTSNQLATLNIKFAKPDRKQIVENI
jgi:hypothetical protein